MPQGGRWRRQAKSSSTYLCQHILDSVRHRFLAQKCPEEGAGAAKRKKEFEEQRAALVAALAAKVKALLDGEDAANESVAGATPAVPAQIAAASEVPQTTPEAETAGSEAAAPESAAPPAETKAEQAVAGSGKQLADDDAVEQAFR